jgi:hypothetical protein
MWEESRGGGVTIYRQKRDGLVAIVKQGSSGWVWTVYDAVTRQLLAASKRIAASPTQTDAYRAAELAMVALVEQHCAVTEADWENRDTILGFGQEAQGG